MSRSWTPSVSDGELKIPQMRVKDPSPSSLTATAPRSAWSMFDERMPWPMSRKSLPTLVAQAATALPA